MTLSFRWRIILSLWLVSGLFVVLTGILSAYVWLHNEQRLIEEKLQTTATALSSMGITDYTGLEGFEKLNRVVRMSLNLDTISQTIQIYTKRGKLMLQSPWKKQDPFWVNFFPIEKPTFANFKWQGKDYKVLMTSYLGKNGKQYYLHLTQDMPALTDIAGKTAANMGFLFLIMGGLAFLIAHALSRGLIKPVQVLAQQLQTVDFTAPGHAVVLKTPAKGDYLTDIVQGINVLSVRVKAMLYRLSRTRRYLAHELGNPLTILAGEANEILNRPEASKEDYKKVIESSLEELARMQNVVETVTKISRVEKNFYQPTLLNLTRWLPGQKTAFEKILKKEIKFLLPKEDVLVMLDTDLLYRLIENLVRNIDKHGKKASQCVIQLQKNTSIVLSVEDDGPGMSPSLIEQINQGRDRGVGIGLSLCLEIANICHFTLHFENKSTGGLKVALLLD